eukprot:2090965-Rhodomonas_salina.1
MDLEAGDELLSEHDFDPDDQEARHCGSEHCSGRIGVRSATAPRQPDPIVYDGPAGRNWWLASLAKHGRRSRICVCGGRP